MLASAARSRTAILARCWRAELAEWLRLLDQGNCMATKRQIAANRRNARHATGPKTPAGKAAASMNALRHGLRARKVVLPGENQEEFDEIHDGLQNLYQPQNAAEQYLVDQASIAQWKLVRAEAYEASSLAKDSSIEACEAMFRRMTLVTGRLERAYFKAYKELESIKSARQPKPQPEPSKAKEKEDEQPANLEVAWVDPETGERELWYQRINGKSVEPVDSSHR
jgi:hypothetical protein